MIKNIRYPLLGLLLGLLCATAQGKDRALLIGIDNYLHVNNLVGSANDVRNMQRFVQDRLGFQGDQIQILLDEQATRAGILAELARLVEDTEAGDRVLFYYSGHGYYQPDTNGDEQDRLDETLVSVDTIKDDQGGFRNMVIDDELKTLFARLDDRQVHIIVDSCHSGTMTRGLMENSDNRYRKTLDPAFDVSTRSLEKALPAHRREESLLKGDRQRVVWSAVSATQIAYVDEESRPRGGVFTRRFLAGLENNRADRNGNGAVTHAELLDYVREQSAAYCQRRGKDCKLGLTPTLEIDKTLLSQPVFTFNQAPPPVPELASEVLTHDNAAGARLEILPDSHFRLGEIMTLRLTSPRAGYAVVLDINAHGKIIQLFPNKYSDKAGKENYMAARQTLTIPDAYYGFKFTAGEPTGRGRLVAIISEDPVPLKSLLNQHKDLQVIADPRDYLTTLAERLRETWTGDRFNRQVQWSLLEAAYEIER